MKKRLFYSEQAAIVELKKAVAGVIDLDRRYGPDLCRDKSLYSAGPTAVKQLYALCECLLYLVCCAKATPDGTEEFPRMKELKKKSDLVDISPSARYAARRISEIEKQCMDAKIPDMPIEAFEEYLHQIRDFSDWAMGILNESGILKSDGIRQIISDIEHAMDIAGHWIKDCIFERRSIEERHRHAIRSNSSVTAPENLFQMIIFNKSIDEDSMTDEELDELYRPRKTNSRKELAILYIYKTLEANPGRRYSVNELVEILEKEHEIKMERKAIGKKIENLAQEDLNICKALHGGGVWYEENLNDEDDYYIEDQL